MVAEHGLENVVTADSAGTGGGHAGDPPDGRMIEHAKHRGYDLTPLRARQFRGLKDFEEFDLILTMDSSNFENVTALTKLDPHLAKVKAMTSYCRIHDVDYVPDPYHRQADGFELVLDILEDACENLVHEIKGEVK